MFCPNCRRQLPDGTKFCSGCGTPIRKPANVPAAEPAAPVTPVENPIPVENIPVSYVPETPYPVESAPVQKPPVVANVKAKASGLLEKIPAKYLKIGAAAVAVLVVIVVAVCLFAGGSSEPNYVMYIKDEQIQYSDFSRNAPYQITKDMLDGYDNAYLSSYASDIGSTLHLTEDGKTLFYLDKLDGSSGTLYYTNLTKPNQDPVKLDSKVTLYSVSKDGKTVTYLRDDTLYQHNLKEDTKVAKEVADYSVSTDGKTVMYTVVEDGVTTYFLYSKGQEEEICTDEDAYLAHTSTDLRTAYYIEDETLYKKEFGKNEVELLSGISRAFNFTDEGTFYYMEHEDVSLADYFVGDEDHSYWMEELEAYEVTLLGSLFYYDGKNSVEVSDACKVNRSASYNGGYIVCYTQGTASIGTFTMDELEEVYYSSYYGIGYTAEQMILDAMTEDSVSYFAIDGVSVEQQLEDIYTLRVSPDGKYLYALCDANEEKQEADLYKATLSGIQIGNFEEVDDSVSTEYGGYFLSDDSNWFYYFKDVDDYTAELYVEGKSVDDDVYVYSIEYSEAKNSLIYLADYDRDDSASTLKIYDGKKAVEIADEVNAFQVSDQGTVAYMCDYDYTKREGTLCYYNGRKSVEIADDAYPYSYTFTADGDVVYIHDYSTKNYRGDLAKFDGRKSVELDEDVVALIPVYNYRYHYFN